MKKGTKILSAVIALILIISMSVSAYGENIGIYVDGRAIDFDVPPQLIGGRTMVPLRAIFEEMGATVLWNDETNTVTAFNEEIIVKATIDSNTMYVNNEPRPLDVPPMLINNRTLVPARFVAEAFGYDVIWDEKTFSVNITTKPINYSNIEKETQYSAVSGIEYYNGSELPTYTSITGVPLKRNDSDKISILYVYDITTTDDTLNYLDTITKSYGWDFFDRIEGEDRLTMYFIKGRSTVGITVQLTYDEVWIMLMK